MWSNDRFSSISTTMCSIRERFSTVGSVSTIVRRDGIAATQASR